MSVKNSRTFLESILNFLNIKTIKSDTDNIAGEVTANAGTNLNTSLLTLESGNLSDIKNATVSGLVGNGSYITAPISVAANSTNEVLIPAASPSNLMMMGIG